MDPRRLFCLGLACFAASFAPPMRAQNTGTPANDPSIASQTAPKKVWTNEDVPTLRENSAISTVGNQNERAAAGNANAAPAQRKDANWYAGQIKALQDKLPPINAQIAELQAGIAGKFTGDGQKSTRPSRAHADDWSAELAALRKKRDDIESHIAAIRDQARHAGIPPNALP